MTVFQLDECISDKRFAKACNAEGRARACRFPRRLRGQGVEDPDVLAEFTAKPCVFVTTDTSLLEDHASHIPSEHAGIIMIGASPNILQTTTTTLVTKILRGVKTAIPDWHDLSWANSVVLVTDVLIEVWHVAGGAAVQDQVILYDSFEWQDALRSVLKQNGSSRLTGIAACARRDPT